MEVRFRRTLPWKILTKLEACARAHAGNIVLRAVREVTSRNLALQGGCQHVPAIASTNAETFVVIEGRWKGSFAATDPFHMRSPLLSSWRTQTLTRSCDFEVCLVNRPSGAE
jgi:hypothetical protein